MAAKIKRQHYRNGDDFAIAYLPSAIFVIK